jgi:hypothetical protein
MKYMVAFYAFFSEITYVMELLFRRNLPVARYVVLRIPPLIHLCQICIYLNTHYQKMDHKLIWNIELSTNHYESVQIIINSEISVTKVFITAFIFDTWLWHSDLYRVSPFQAYRTSTSCLPHDLEFFMFAVMKTL